MSRAPLYVWRKLSAAKWEDAWIERLAIVRDRLAITAFAGHPTIRVEVFALTRAEAGRLVRNFGGETSVQKKASLFAIQPARPPIRVRNKLLVVSSERDRHEVAASDAHRHILYLPAGMAFGTGEHATTASCLRLLADVSDRFRGQTWDALDLGTGSGILAIAARMLGARCVEAADFDPHAVRVAKENLRRNGVDRVAVRRLDVREWQPKRMWQVVTANMFSGILMEIAPKLAAATRSDGQLIFSGILREQEREVVAALEANTFRVISTVRKGKWFTGLAEKP